jgi:threonine/homoserine/homoserine lactone efflux protein
MIQTIFSGIGLGLTLAIMLGPAFFALLQTSIDKGFGCGVRLAIGICASDAFLIVIVLLGVTSFLENPTIWHITGLVGGGMLVGMGTHAFLHRSKGREIKVDQNTENAAIKKLRKRIEDRSHISKLNRFYLKGFLLNLANPAVWFFWIFSVGLVSSQYINTKGGPDIFYLTIFFTCTLTTVLITDLLKAFGAHHLRSKINDKVMTIVNAIFALILIGFGVYLIVKSLYPIFEIMHRYYQLRQV